MRANFDFTDEGTMRWTCCLLVLLAGCTSQTLTTTQDGGADQSATTDMPTPTGDLGMQMSCDPIAQNCADPSQRCVFTITGTGMSRMLVTQCVANGTAMRDQSCTIDMTSGLDDCQKGLTCTGLGLPTGMSDCRKFCKTDSDCGAGQMCHGVGGGVMFGECLPTCTEFGTDCGAGMTCAQDESDISSTMTNRVSFLVCRSVGAGTEGADCQRATDCGADMLCIGPFGQRICSPLCDDTTHTTCPVYGVPDGGNVDAGTVTSCVPYRGTIEVCE